MAMEREGEMVLEQRIQSDAATGNENKENQAGGEFSRADVEAQARPRLG